MLITNKEAREHNLPGSDTFIGSHLMHMKGINREFQVALLNYESYKTFEDLFMIKQSAEIIDEANSTRDFIKSGKHLGKDEYRWPVNHFKFGRVRNLEFLKIGCGLELCLKAKLVRSGYIVHCIDNNEPIYKSISKQQKDRPISIDELTAICGFMYNGETNILPGLGTKSIQFTTLIDKPRYVSVYGLDAADIETIRDYRDLRNGIHLPGDPIRLKSKRVMEWEYQIKFIRHFVKKHIIDVNRDICRANNLSDSLQIQEYESNQALHQSP